MQDETNKEVCRMKKNSYTTDCCTNQGSSEKCACSLCGQLYNNFAFKGGYICEDCLDVIKDRDDSPHAYNPYKTKSNLP